ncbi:universal stress protein [Pedobacter sp. BS3]|uniref:universal stress protein n=1 Tax=Pedobacter sp. BS3 TaxID=2567937 RepID=UPI0011EFA507|nr:universal stress protein [Pedobacter sp. BS3]TZF81722.1 universal stress protein [Pedobacter sp. BS3]
MKYDRILIVADDSPPSLKAVQYGYDLAAQLHAKVGLIGVTDQALAEGNVDAGVFPDQAAHLLKKHMEEFLHQVVRDYSNGVETEIFAPEGEVKATVLQMAKVWDAQLIVAGTHGRKGLNRLLMGSMAEGILRDSHVPVFIVPIDKEH